MTKVANIQKANFPHLVKRACAGEEIILYEGERPVAKLIPYIEKEENNPKPKTLCGALQGNIKIKGDIIAPLDVEWNVLTEKS